MPLQVKLPLLMSALLAVVLTVTTVGTYATLRDYAVSRVEDRLIRASRQIAALSSAGLVTQRTRYAGIAADSAVRGALAAGRMTRAARASLEAFPLPADTGLALELWTADGRRLALLGPEERPGLDARQRPEIPEPIRSAMARRPSRSDTLVMTPLYEENGRTHLWYVVPVWDGGRPIGYVLHKRRIAASPQTQRTLRELSGDSVSLHWRNEDGSYWASSEGRPMTGIRDVDTTTRHGRTNDGTEILVNEERIPGTPFVLGLSVPARTVLANPQRAARRLMLIGALALVLGSLAAWGIGRSVSRPVADVATAADALGHGNYDVRVPETGELEMRRLAASFNTMASEISAARAALERQTREAQAANSAKSEFLTTMSHELRTPLNAIGGYVDLLDLGVRGPISDAQRRDLLRIKASQEHLLGLISSVLDLSRIESGQIAYERVGVPVDLFLATIEDLVGPQVAAKSITLQREVRVPDLTALADREKLRQVMINLLSNAIRHTPEGGRIRIVATPRGGWIAIEVEDTGPGIPADKRESVFEPFVQLDRSLSQTREGLGLGLAISRDLARGMGGDLVVEEAPGGGARFVVTLPIADYASAAPVSRTGELPAAAKKG